MSEKNFIPGEAVYVVCRDEDGYAVDTAGYLFLARVGNVMIVTPWINDYEDLEDILRYHVEETCRNDHTDLPAYHIDDCYATREEAQAVFESEAEEDDE